MKWALAWLASLILGIASASPSLAQAPTAIEKVPSGSARDAAEYFGLTPGLQKTTAGWARSYNEDKELVRGPEIRDGAQLWRVERLMGRGTSSALHRVDSKGVWLVALEVDGQYTAFPTPSLILALPIERGTKWQIKWPGGQENAEIVSIEDVDVRIGTFRSCAKVSTTGRFGEDTKTGTEWYCRGVGLVKKERTVTFKAETSKVHYEITNFASPSLKVAFQPISLGEALEALARRYGARRVVSCEELSRNPFAFEGQVVMLPTMFHSMLEREKGYFVPNNLDTNFVGPAVDPRMCGLVVSGVPPQTFSTERAYVFVAGRVLGNTEVHTGFGVRPVPHLKFVGVEPCRRDKCADFSSKGTN